MKPSSNTLLLIVALALLAPLGAVLGTMVAYLYVAPGLPDVETLRTVRLEEPLRVYSRDGRLIGEFGERRSIPVGFEEVPETVVQAFIAAEDDRFFEHPGVDYQGLIRAAYVLFATGEKRQGGSTITMQVARGFFLSNEKRFIRKIREIFLALEIERTLSKQEILALYLNKIFLGHRAYGVAAAAEVYYGKPLDALTLAEVATLAGLPKAPSTDNPVTSPERALARRAYVLRRMYDLGHIDQAAFDAAVAAPTESLLHGPTVELAAPYIAEMARADVVARVGAGQAYTAGYKVTTTLDSRLHRAAVTGIRRALIEYDRRHGYRGPLARRPEWLSDEAIPVEALDEYRGVEGLALGFVTESGPAAASVLTREHGPVELGLDAVSWARRRITEDVVGDPPEKVADVVRPGDVVYIETDDAGAWRLGQVPDVQGAFVALDPQDGAVVALIGGFDFYASKFNRVTQARRQPGSSFKPFIYSAALENGFTPASLIPDSPIVVDDPGRDGVWKPENYSRRFHGLMRLREALVKSRNLVSVRVLREMGLDYTIDYVQRFGFAEAELPRGPSLALGSASLTPLQMAAGYAVLASGGYRPEPYWIQRIEAADGSVLFAADPLVVCDECMDALLAAEIGADVQPDFAAAVVDPVAGAYACEPDPDHAPDAWYGGDGLAPRVVSAQNAYLIADIMRDVVRRGTGVAATRELQAAWGDARTPADLSGKTGTTNDQQDAWFSGFNADLVATAWVGFDQVLPLGRGEVGGRAALPAWSSFMKEALAGVPEHALAAPSGIVRVKISPDSGKLASAGDPDWMEEVFREGHVPQPDFSADLLLQSETEDEAREEPLF